MADRRSLIIFYTTDGCNHAERIHSIQWFNDLHRWFIGDKILILGGDFNCVENKSIDKIVGNDAYGDVGGAF